MTDPLPKEASLTEWEACDIAVNAHGGQRDRDAALHIEHVARVASSVLPFAKAVAWLHDVLEDTDYPADDLEARMLPVEWEALRLLTRKGGQTYSDYVAGIAAAKGQAGTLARVVKTADLEDNLTRSLASHDRAALRYVNALTILWER